MECPECKSTHIRKNGIKRGKQNHICVNYGRQFIACYETSKGYSDEVKQECLKMYVNGMGFRGIEREITGGIIPPATLARVKGVHHTTIIYWLQQVGKNLPDAYDFPQVGELDELETFVGAKKTKFGARSAVNHFTSGILAWVLGDHSAKTFAPSWQQVEAWQCYFIVTDRGTVYPCFIDSGDHIVSKTYRTQMGSI